MVSLYVNTLKDGVNICEHTKRWCHVIPSSSVFTYIYPLLIEKDICDCGNVSVKLRVFICAFHLAISSFFFKSFLFLFLFLYYLYFVNFPFHVVSLLIKVKYTNSYKD
jgi:hypothetical protein